MNNSIDFLLSVQDDRADADELRSILVNLATQLDRFSADVTEVPASEAVATGMIPKGDDKGNLLDVKINLDPLKQFAKWLYDRLVGGTTKATFEYDGQKFEFNGRNEQDRAAAMRDFEKFVIAIERAKKAKNNA
jgi:hypothetical protein